MTVLLDHAFERVREFADRDQDDIAATMLAHLPQPPVPSLDAATRAAIAEGLAQVKAGRFASDAEMAALLGRSVT